ncbi:uncharacterized protein M6B38_127650 [Iris pallida]|uniref:Uncharacterized protein n=1 Tax=Iris pallida TaxID=29817 RepID=A0AAX6G5T9_IRIPA|nr:uncharacterized protein M6B38_127650 [Iris pallida]
MASSRYSSGSGHRHPSHPLPADDMALARTKDRKNPNSLGSMVKKLISSTRPKSADRTALPLPLPRAAAPQEKPSKLSSLHRKLFPKGGSADRTCRGAALAEAKPNTRTLAMVLRSERDLLAQNKEREDQISELKLLLEERNRQVEKLKDLCLKQREEIKALKDAILFPDVINTQLHDLLEKQGSELKHARQVIPSLQEQVASLTGKLRCVADDLAEVKADKYATRTCFDEHVNSPETPKHRQEAPNSLEYSSGGPTSVYGSPDDMFLKDLNPCLTPCFSKTKSKEYDEMSGYGSPDKDVSFEESTDLSAEIFSGSLGAKLSKSSENHRPAGPGSKIVRKICKSDESKWSIGKSRHQKSLLN